MKNLKKAIILVLCFAMLLTLCACGSKEEMPGEESTGDSIAKEESQEPVTEDSTDPPTETMDADYTLSEYLSGGETIWYWLREDEGKDSSVKEIHVLEPDGSMYYCTQPGYTLGELAQMEDADIAAMVKEKYAESVAAEAVGFIPSPEAEESVKAGIKKWLIYGDFIDLTRNDYGENPVTLEIAKNYASSFLDKAEPGVAVKAVEEEWESIEPIYAALSAWFQNNSDEVTIPIFDNFYLFFAASDDSDVESIFDFLEESIGRSGAYFMALDEFKVVFTEILALSDTAANNVYDNLAAQYEETKANVAPVQYRLAIITDSTGNNTASELLAYQYYESSETLRIRDFELNYRYPVQSGSDVTTNCTTVVYDSIYGGYNVDDYGVVYTRVSGPAHLQLDAVGAAGLPIDVDADSLFG